VYQDPQKYSMVSVKYQNQIVTTLNPYFKENDSILKAGKMELAKAPTAAAKKTETKPKTVEAKKTGSTLAKPKETTKAKTHTKETKKTTAPAKPKPKAKVKIE
ncbi:cell division protein FtsQ, partial [Chryseobacterium sp. HMWF028]